jgi:hypothetical protein
MLKVIFPVDDAQSIVGLPVGKPVDAIYIQSKTQKSDAKGTTHRKETIQASCQEGFTTNCF